MDSDNLEDDLSSGDDEAVVPTVFGALYALMQLAGEEDEDEEEEASKVINGYWGGNRKGRAKNVMRDFKGAHQTLAEQYFSGADSLYNESTFK